MGLDVAIRAIKIALIRMLAPIPISSYIMSKDKFNKFVKISIQVYADLFIRMLIIYVVIFVIQSLITAGLLKPTGMVDTGSWIYDMLLHIVVIIGLFMFAKNAPKFVTDLLGLPEIKGNDMVDMFKPAWQRAGGAVGQMINPWTTAAANYRQARRENGRSVGESLRRAMGGFGRGAMDSVQGMMAGDDWAKMRNRHDAAVKKSANRTLIHIKREREEEVNRRKLDRLHDRLSQLSGAIGLDSSFNSQAETLYNNHVNGLNSRLQSLQHDLNSGTLTAAERRSKVAEIEKISNQLNNLNTDEGKQKFINEQKYMLSARKAQVDELNGINTRIASARSRIQAINNEISRGVTDERRAELEIEKNNLMNQSREDAQRSSEITIDKAADLQKRVAEYKQKNADNDKEREDIQKQIRAVEEMINEPIHGAVFNSFDTYFGGPGSQGRTYLNFADTLGKNRSSIYTGEAMTKMAQNANILVDENGNPALYKTDFSTNGSQFSYEQITTLLSQYKSGQVDDAALASKGLNAATLESAFKDIEKKAAKDYINANIVAADGDRVIGKNPDGSDLHLSETIKVRLKKGSVPNTTIVEWWDRFENDILASGLSSEETSKYKEQFIKNPGDFIAKASDLKERLTTRGTRIVDAEKPKDGK